MKIVSRLRRLLRVNSLSTPTYHDVVVYVDGQEYCLSDHYGLELTCTRAGGWQLWNTWNKALDQAVQIGGEYHGGDFRIEVAGHVICDSTKGREE